MGDAYSFLTGVTGFDPIAGVALSDTERGLAIASAAVLGGGFWLAGRMADDVARDSRTLAHVADDLPAGGMDNAVAHRADGGNGLSRVVRETPTPSLSSGLSTARRGITEGSSAGALVTWYPPNRGFLGSPTQETLSVGTQVDRYGREGGTFVSPVGTPTEMRALPPGATERPYSIYEVSKPIEVPTSIADLLEQGALKAVGR